MFLQLAHTKLDVFKQTKSLVLEVYKLTKYFPSEERFALTQQLRRAALSALFNVAEGCSRKSGPERRRFFEISRGSVNEIDTALDISLELKYCNTDELGCLGDYIVSSFKQLSALINKENRTEYPH